MSVYHLKVDTEDPSSIINIILLLKQLDLFRVLDLSETSFVGTSFRHSDFRRANFHRSILKDADLGSAYFQGAVLLGANLQKADLKGAKMTPKQLSEIIIVPE